jgi:hypothetical protein
MLDKLVAEACTRTLSSEEAEQLYRLAYLDSKMESVLVKLLLAKTAAGRANLVAVRALMARSKSRRAVLPPRKQQRSVLEVKSHSERLPFVVTDHAFERFAERCMKGQSYEEVQVYLNAEALSATPVRQRTLSGEQKWVSQSGVVFVMRRDGNGALPVCVTVLPREDEDHVTFKVRAAR